MPPDVGTRLQVHLQEPDKAEPFCFLLRFILFPQSILTGKWTLSIDPASDREAI